MGFIDPSLLETDDTDNVTCSICMQLLDTPMSPAGCQEGHTFCASCLRDALKAAPRCPTCRAASSQDALTRNRFAEKPRRPVYIFRHREERALHFQCCVLHR